MTTVQLAHAILGSGLLLSFATGCLECRRLGWRSEARRMARGRCER